MFTVVMNWNDFVWLVGYRLQYVFDLTNQRSRQIGNK